MTDHSPCNCDDSIALRKRVAELENATRFSLAKFENYFEEYGAEHVEDCPEDDTCACPLVIEVNRAFKALKLVVSVGAAVYRVQYGSSLMNSQDFTNFSEALRFYAEVGGDHLYNIDRSDMSDDCGFRDGLTEWEREQLEAVR